MLQFSCDILTNMMNPIKRISTAIVLSVLSSTSALAQKAPLPYGALPSKHQLAWHDMEYYMFIHFGPNTFTDKKKP